jgi:hypothetical protein
MMDLNSFYLSGWCKKAGVNEGKFGPSGWALIDLQAQKGDGWDIPAHSVFVGFNLSADNPDKVAKNRDKFNKIQEGGFITVWDNVIDSYVKHGETKVNRRLKGSIVRFMITKDAGVPVNLGAFVGKVIQQPTPEWCELQCSHRPGPNANKGDPWPTRSIKVFLPGGRIKVRVGHQYFIAGKISGKTPAGSDDLIVVASVANGV